MRLPFNLAQRFCLPDYWRQVIVEKGQQILLIGFGTGQRGQIARADITTTTSSGKTQIGMILRSNGRSLL